MLTKKQYAALGCYYGQWPSYFQLWLTSCSYNTAIDYFLVIDIRTEAYDIPQNVIIISMSFECLVNRISHIIQLPTDKYVSCNRHYKLCDYKVAYGHLFKNLFEGYNYWGFYDIDTIWGDILRFIPNNQDNHWLKIFPCGHLSFVRNKFLLLGIKILSLRYINSLKVKLFPHGMRFFQLQKNIIMMNTEVYTTILKVQDS